MKREDILYYDKNYEVVFGDIYFENNIVTKTVEKDKPKEYNKSDILLPPLADIHIHGGYGVDFMHCNEKDLIYFTEQAKKDGIGAFMPTTVACEYEAIYRLSESIARANIPEIWGIHIEGPFINKKHKGVMDEKYIRECDMTLYDNVKSILPDKVIRFTIAPETEGAEEFCEYVCKKGDFVSLGHSGATKKECEALKKRGASSYTHVFNAMSPLFHRSENILSCALTDELYCEIIADKIHICSNVLDIVGRCKKDKLILVSDAIFAMACKEGRYKFCGREINVKAGKAYTDENVIAGSVLKLKEAVKNMSDIIGEKSAVKAASENPARLLHKFDVFGSIEEGKYIL